MNADFEAELSHISAANAYRRLPFFDALNQRLAPHLLWLASAGDSLLIEEPGATRSKARPRGVELN